MISATNGWLVALDNLSGLPAWLSDALCRLSTGGGFATRQLYSDSDEVFLDAVRPTILTGIEDIARRSDLADRAVYLHLPAIKETARRTEADFWAEFDEAYSGIFGSLLDAVSGGLARLPGVTLDRLPRMADFARWGEAVWRALGHKDGAFLETYEKNRKDATEAVLDDSPVAAVVRSFMEGKPKWEGKPSALLDALNDHAPDRAAKDRWPKSPRGLTGQLRRLAPALRAAGWNLDFGIGHDRVMTLSPVEERDGRAQPPQRAPEACLPGCACARCAPDVRTSPGQRAHETQGPEATGARSARCVGENPTLIGGTPPVPPDAAPGREVFEL
jgi:hypothetical protein